MKNIEQLLTEFNIELPADSKDSFMKEFTGNYKTVSEFTKKADRISELEQQLSDGTKQVEQLTARISELDGSDKTIADLKEQIAAFEKEAEERKNAEAAARHDAILTENIMNAIGDKQFTNDIVKNAIIDQVKTQMNDSANAGKGAKEILDSITQDVEGIWVNPQQQSGSNPIITEKGGSQPNGSGFNVDEYLQKRGLDK